MSNEIIYGFKFGTNEDTAKWVNKQHYENTKSFVVKGIEIGKVLYSVQISDDPKFAEWVRNNLKMHISTAYDYIKLFKYQKEVSGAGTVTEAYKMIETLEAQKKKSETARAYQRVADFRKTGIKPEGWRRGTDDKIAKEEAERDARIENVKKETISKREKFEEKKQTDEEERKKRKAETDELIDYLDKSSKELQKRIDFKEKIRISAQGTNEPFMDALIDFLESLNDDNRRIEACYNIIKICKRIAVELQGSKNPS